MRDVRSLGSRTWSVQRFNDTRGTPWEPVPGREGIDIRARVLMPEGRGKPSQLIRGEDRDQIVRRMRTNHELIRKLGFIVGCPGRSLPAFNHDEECRQRLDAHLRSEGNQRVLLSDERIRERDNQRDMKRRKLAGGSSGR